MTLPYAVTLPCAMPYLQISFGWSTVKIDMSAARRVQPLMPFSVPAFAATLFALGLALGTTIAVGMLFFIQVRDVLLNATDPKLFENVVHVIVAD